MIEAIVAALGAKRVGRNWMALCPAHEDKNPSLAISVAENGKVLFFCYAGCAQRDVFAAVLSKLPRGMSLGGNSDVLKPALPLHSPIARIDAPLFQVGLRWMLERALAQACELIPLLDEEADSPEEQRITAMVRTLALALSRVKKWTDYVAASYMKALRKSYPGLAESCVNEALEAQEFAASEFIKGGR